MVEARGFEPRSATLLPTISFTGLVPLGLDLRTGPATFFTNVFASSTPLSRRMWDVLSQKRLSQRLTILFLGCQSPNPITPRRRSRKRQRCRWRLLFTWVLCRSLVHRRLQCQISLPRRKPVAPDDYRFFLLRNARANSLNTSSSISRDSVTLRGVPVTF